MFIPFFFVVSLLANLGSSEPNPSVVDTAVIGGGLSGLTAALRLLESGASVALIDKAPFFGGNSAKVFVMIQCLLSMS